jgi:hypothetical protein
VSAPEAIPLTDDERRAKRGKAQGTQVVCTNCGDGGGLQPDFMLREFTCMGCGAVMEFQTMTVLRFNEEVRRASTGGEKA